MIWSRSSRARPGSPLLFFMTKPSQKLPGRRSTLTRQSTPARQTPPVHHLLICVGQVPNVARFWATAFYVAKPTFHERKFGLMGSEKHKDVAVRWATMMNKAMQEDPRKRPV